MKKPEIEELPNEEVIYKVISSGTKRPQSKVMKKTKIIKLGKVNENEEQVPHDVIIYEPIEEEKPTIKIIRKKIVPKDGKDVEVEEDPGKQVIYKTAKFGHYRNPQTKIIRKRIIDDNGKDKRIEEDIPGDEVIVKKIKYGKEPNAKILTKIIIVKDGKEQEIEEEVPIGEETTLEQVEEIITEKEPTKVIRKKIIIEDGKKKEFEEEVPIEELEKEGEKPTKAIIKKTIIKDGKKEEIEEEVPVEDINKYLKKKYQ